MYYVKAANGYLYATFRTLADARNYANDRQRFDPRDIYIFDDSVLIETVSA